MFRVPLFFVSLMAFCTLRTTADYVVDIPGAISSIDPFDSPEIHPDAWTTPINQVSQVACHNCYEPEIFDYPLPEALNHIKAIELDIWDQSTFLLGNGISGSWFVRHNPYSYSGSNSNHNNCSGSQFLTDCLNDIHLWSNSNPDHFPITLFLDKKQSWSRPHEGRAPRDLFELLERKLGDKLYLPKQQAILNDLEKRTPARWIWPTAEELRGRIIVVINGGNFISSSNWLPFFKNNATYNSATNQIRTFDESSTAFAGPYVFAHDDFKILPFNDFKSQAVFLNSNYSAALGTLLVNYLNTGKIHNRLLRLWKVDDHSFCSLLKFRVAYLAYYNFVQQDCRGYRIIPMGYDPDELINGKPGK